MSHFHIQKLSNVRKSGSAANFLSILKPWVEPHRAKSPNQPGIKSFPSTALDDHRQRAAPFCIASYSPRINSVRNAGGNFFDDHQSLVSFLSQRLTLAETQALHFLMNRSGCNYTAQATSVNLKINSVRATRARTINRANRLSPCSVKVTFFHHVAIVI